MLDKEKHIAALTEGVDRDLGVNKHFAIEPDIQGLRSAVLLYNNDLHDHLAQAVKDCKTFKELAKEVEKLDVIHREIATTINSHITKLLPGAKYQEIIVENALVDHVRKAAPSVFNSWFQIYGHKKY